MKKMKLGVEKNDVQVSLGMYGRGRGKEEREWKEVPRSQGALNYCFSAACIVLNNKYGDYRLAIRGCVTSR